MEYYLEYEIKSDRPGLLGDVASLIGMLRINIERVSSIAHRRRGFLLTLNNLEQIQALLKTLNSIPDLAVTHANPPEEQDLLALKHGKRIHNIAQDPTGPPIYRFTRADLDYLIDFLGCHLGKLSSLMVGLRGSPRIGKSETIIAAAVHANKPWVLISSTLFKQVARTFLDEATLETEPVLIFDAVTTFQRSLPEHRRFVQKLLRMPLLRVVEHPDILIRETDFEWRDFDLIIELVSSEDDNIGGTQGYGLYNYDIS